MSKVESKDGRGGRASSKQRTIHSTNVHQQHEYEQATIDMYVNVYVYIAHHTPSPRPHANTLTHTYSDTYSEESLGLNDCELHSTDQHTNGIKTLAKFLCIYGFND